MINNIKIFIKTLFTKHIDTICFYKTNKNEKIFFRKELNILIKNKPSIKTVSDGKKIFYRFLKENNFFVKFLKLSEMTNNCNIDGIIRFNFSNPFSPISECLIKRIERYKYGNHDEYQIIVGVLHEMIVLNKKWNELLKSINYFNK